jgi:isopenicillin-N N-acyltransferase-like protein
MNQFPLITISGEPFERGRQHGEQLSVEIANAIDFYRSIFDLPESEILQHADFFRKLINDFEPDYCEEINGIAQGAGVDPLWIVALNARTEILSHKAAVSNECTSVYFPEPSILGQNWDWGRALEPLTVLMKIVQKGGHIILMLTEPGIIGKIGMNNSGLGVCLNILTLGKVLDGLPVHIILRAILDCKTLDQVDSLMAQHGTGKASNIIVADANGNGFDMEFCGDDSYRLTPEQDYLLHTNHYLGKPINSEQDPDFASSYTRFNRATKFLSDTKERSSTAMRELLSDETDSALPIYREYLADDSVHELGTICTIIMVLEQQKMHVRKGKGPGAKFFEYQLGD